MLASQYELSPEAAFEKLTAQAADTGHPVVDVARQIVEDGGLESYYETTPGRWDAGGGCPTSVH